MDLLAGSGPVHQRPVLGDRQQRLLDDVVRDRRIEEVKGVAQAVGEDGLVDRVPTEGASRSERLGVGVDDGPPQLGEQIECGILDEFGLGVAPRVHATDSTMASRSRDDTSICPVTSLGRRRSLSEARVRLSPRRIGTG